VSVAVDTTAPFFSTSALTSNFVWELLSFASQTLALRNVTDVDVDVDGTTLTP
jgi:hypothetical protein